MSALLFLTSDDFSIQKGTKGPIMCHSIPDFSLILFYSTRCEHCNTLVPIFKQLPRYIDGCQFGMVNVGTNKKCVMMSRETIAPITVVPYIILYYNSRPHMRYQGPYDIREIAKFVVEVTKAVRGKQQFMSQTAVIQKKNNSIPEYTIGHPLCGDDGVCYLDFNDAYGEEGGGGGGSVRENVNGNQNNKVGTEYRKKRVHLLPPGSGMR